MKAIKCELCGSGDLIKENGVFVCQHCGTKYSLEEARKLLVEISGSVDVQGTVKIDKDTKRELIVESQVSFYEIFVDGQKLGSFTKTAKVFIDNGPHNVYCARTRFTIHFYYNRIRRQKCSIKFSQKKRVFDKAHFDKNKLKQPYIAGGYFPIFHAK